VVESTAATSEVTAALNASPLIASFQTDTIVSGSQLPNDPTFVNGSDSYLDQYALYNIGQDSGTAGADIDADLAWNITHGSSNVVIAVIDSGIDYVHADLAANIWTNPGEIAGNGIDDDANGYIDDVHGYDFHNRDSNPMDDQGHGTHVAGIVGAVGNNSLGVTGVNWTTSLLPVKFLDQNNVGSVAHAVEAVNYVTMLRTRAVNPVNVRVINASWGGSGVDDSQLKAAIQAAGAAGILFVTSAGNGDVFGRGQNIDQLPFFPASFHLDNTVVVAATDRNDQLTTFSNYGTNTVDIAAPGLSILSSNLFIDGATTIEGYETRSGTSMATPLVTGTAAMVWATAPNATVAEVRDAILHGANSLASLNGKVAGGRRLNAYGALVALPPQAAAGSLSNISLPGATPYTFTVTLSSNTVLQDATIGTGDFIVRRQGGGSDLVANLVSKTSSNGDKTWTVTYSVLPADGNWDVFDTGTYQIEFVAGQVLDLNNVPSRQKVLGTFMVDFSALGVFRPDVFTDGADANPGDGFAKSAGDVTTLRAAIQEANLVNLGIVPTGGTVILKPGTYNLTLGGAGEDAAATGDLDITGKVTIASDGTGPVTINANGIDRVFDVLAGGNLILQGVTVTGGYAVGEDGGGVRNNGTLTVNNSTIENNTTTLNGGGIVNAAGKSATITASIIANNTAAGSSTQVLQLNGSPTLVNTTTAGGQYDPDISVNALGQAVVTWTNNPDGITWNNPNNDVFAQRFNADGSRNGAQFQVNTAHNQVVQNPDVVLHDNGEFAAVFEVDYSVNFDVGFASFDSAGASLSGGTVQITGASGDQFRSQIVQTTDGGYLLIINDTSGIDGSGYGTFARRVSRTGVVSPAFDAVPNITSGSQLAYAAIRLANGNILVAWHDDALDGSGWGIFGRILDGMGNPVVGQNQFPINSVTAGNQYYADLTATSNGFVATWYGDNGVSARLFDSLGSPLGTDILVAAPPGSGALELPSAAVLSDGSFIVVWAEYTAIGSPVNKLWMRRYDASGVSMSNTQLITATARFVNNNPVIRADRAGHAYILWDGAGSGDTDGVFMQKLSLVNQPLGGNGGGIYNAGTITATQTTIDGNDAALNGGGIYNATGATATVTSSTVSENEAIGSTRQQYQPSQSPFFISGTTSGNPRVPEVTGNGNGRAFVTWEGDQTGVTEVYGAFVESTGLVGSQTFVSDSGNIPDSARAGITIGLEGRVIAAWQANGDIQLRTYYLDQGVGSATGITTVHDGSVSSDARVAVNSAGLGMIVWLDGAYIRAQLFQQSPGGGWTWIGGTFLVNSSTTITSYLIPDVAVDAQGNFAVVWNSRPVGEPRHAIYMQRYDNNGIAIGGETKISSSPLHAYGPRVEGGENGFVAVWEYRPDSGLDYDVVARRFDASGAFLSGEFSLADDVTGEQGSPHLVVLPEGGFYAVWYSNGPADVGTDIHGQEFSPAGAKVGNEIIINSSKGGLQNRPSVSLLAANKLFVAWYTEGGGVYGEVVEIQSIPAGGDGGGIYNAGTITSMTNVTVSGNSAANQGGGIYNADGATAAITNSTITANSSNGEQAGGFLSPVTNSFAISNNVSNEHLPSLDVNSAGKAVVSWTRSGGSGDQKIHQRVLDGLVTSPSAPEAQVSTTGLEQPNSAVALHENGNFDVVFDGWGFGSEWGIHIRSYTPGAGGEGGVETNGSGSQQFPGIAVGSNGTVAIYWLDVNLDGGGYGASARIFGTSSTSDFRVNQSVAGTQWPSDAEVLDDGSVIFVYYGASSIDPDSGVYGRRFTPSGTPLTDEKSLNSSISGQQGYASVARSGNQLIAAWIDLTTGAINAQRLDLQLNYIGGVFTVAQIGIPNMVYETPSIASLPNGGFVVAWSQITSANGTQDVYACDFDSAGLPVGNAYVVDTNVVGTQHEIKVDSAANGDTLFAWTGELGNDANIIAGRKFVYQRADAPGMFSAATSTVTVKNTIVAGNTSTHNAADVQGSFSSNGGNLIGNIGGATGFTQPSDQVGTSASPLDPKLGPLADNGGPTKTHVPTAPSPAIDAGVAAGAPAADQRGVARPQDGNNSGTAQVDIGAVERYYGSIRGRKFQDQNQNGVQEIGELGLAGWTMFLDANNNGLLDAGEVSTTTDANGDYAFTQLTPGSYTLAEVNQTGWTRTYTGTQFLQQFLDVNSGTLGLDGASSIASTADGKFLYVAGASEAKIQRFSRDLTTGLLTPLGTTTTTEVVSGTNILQDVVKLVMAPVATSSGLYLYALTSNGALGVFSVNTLSGDLTLADVVRNGDTNRGTTVARLVGATGLAVSPDGLRVYVSNFSANALNGGSLLIFERVTGQSPELRLRRILSNGNAGAAPYGAGGRGAATYGNQVYVVGETVDSSDTLATFTVASSPAYLNYVSVLRNGQNDSLGHLVSGLDGANDIAISSDGKFVYVSAATSGAVSVFARDTAGVLTFVESLAESGTDALGHEVHGVQAASSVTISGDGSRVYVTGRKYFSEFDISLGAVAAFSRDATTGRLTYLESLVDTIPDIFGNPIENLENVVDAYASTNQLYTIAGVDEDALTAFERDTAGRDSVTLLVGDDRTGFNFSSYAAPAEIRGTVYNDLNNNGLRDADEYGLGGIAVYLDLNNNNSYQAGEPTASTDPIGNYRFDNLTAPRAYTVRLNLLSNSTVTAPSAAQDREWALSLAPNQIYVGADFNVYTQLAGNGGNQISGRVWQDANKNGLKDASESYLAGKWVYLDVNDNGVYNAGVDIRATGVTTADGLYSFTDLGAANFVVRVELNASELTTTAVGNSFTKQTLTTGNNPLGLVTADFNGDTLPDLASVDGGTDKVSVRLQQVGGTFATRSEYAVGVQPTSIAVGKFNNDSAPDIAVVQWAYSKVVFLINKNDGSGTFVRSPYEIPISSGYSTIVAADIDLDGDDDLAVAVDGASDVLHILRNNGGGLSFTDLQQLDLQGAGPLSLAAGDLTNDGRPEFVVGNFDGDSVRVAKNNSGTSFTLQTALTVGDGPSTVAITPDLTGDGKRDVVVASIGSSTVTILAGDNAGGLTLNSSVPVGQGPRSIAVVDVDKDNDLDIVLGNTTTNDVVVLRKQGGTFSFPESTGLASFASLAASGVKQVLVTDINKDNTLDLVAVRGDANTGSLAVLTNALAPGSIRLSISGSNQQIVNQNFGIAPPLLGDYDGNGLVQSADYAFWRAHFGDTSGAGLAADGNGNNVVDAADYIIWRNALAAAASGSGALLANDQTATASISAVPLVELALAASAAVPAFEPVAAVPAKETVFAAWSVEMFAPTRGTPSRRSALGEPLVVATSPQLELLLAALAESSTSLDVEPPAATSERTADSLFETLEPLELAFDWDDVAEASRGDEP
jgi:hypothetical protein